MREELGAMNYKINYLSFYCMIFWICISSLSGQTQWRILVDISGSMKKNDPENYRQESLSILKNIVPDDLEVGIYSFAMNTEELIEPSIIDKSWINKWESQKNKIDYRGQWTNIAGALEKVIPSWNNEGSKHIILITDGLVDISRDRDENTKSRWKVFHDHLATLQRGNIHVHTLSFGQSSDLELLQVLSHATDGYYDAINNADEVYDYFLNLIKIGADYQQLPISDHQFKVDHGAGEILVLSPSKNKPLLQDPAGEVYPADFKLIRDTYTAKISNPKSGIWQISGSFRGEPSVLITSEIKLSWTQAPSLTLLSRPLEFVAKLEGWPDTLKPHGSCSYNTPETFNLRSLGNNTHGCHAILLPKSQEGEQKFNFETVYKDPLFERKITQNVHVLPHPGEISKEFDHERDSWVVTLTPNIIFWDMQSLSVEANMETGEDAPCSFDNNNSAYKCIIPNTSELDQSLLMVLSGHSRANRFESWHFAPIVLKEMELPSSPVSLPTLPLPVREQKRLTPGIVDVIDESLFEVEKVTAAEDIEASVLEVLDRNDDDLIENLVEPASIESVLEVEEATASEDVEAFTLESLDESDNNVAEEKIEPVNDSISSDKEVSLESLNEQPSILDKSIESDKLQDLDSESAKEEQAVPAPVIDPQDFSLESEDNSFTTSFIMQQLAFLTIMAGSIFTLAKVSQRLKRKSLEKIDNA